MSPSAHILVVATKDVQEPIGQTLRHDGYAVSSTDSCAEAIQSIEEASPDIVVLHARLGGGRTGATLMELAEARGVPVLVLGRRDGLDEPGYLRRDVNRVRRLVASHLSTTSSTGQLEVGEVTVDTVHHVACVGQRSLDLTRKEFELLCHLMRRPGWTWTRQQLLEQVWGYDLADPRVVTVHVGNLRRKLAQAARESPRAPGTSPLPRQAFIQTVKGVGYRYARLEQAAGAATTTAAAQPSRPAHPPRSPFLGRENEMAILEQSLDDALGGCVQTVVLAGDAGMGKTRLAEEFSIHARGLGATVQWGTCHDRPAGPAYAPWVEIFEHWDYGGSLGELPAVFADRPPESIPAHRKSQHDRYLFLVRFTEAVRARALRAPACLVLENLHWADASTLLAVLHLVRHLREAPLMLLLTYRPTASGTHRLLVDILAEIACSDSGAILPLAPLTPAEVERFIHEHVGAIAGVDGLNGLSTHVYEVTEGNPLFLSQLMRPLRLRCQDPEFTMADLDLGREEGVRNFILKRLSVVSSPCRRWLDAGAVFGREFTGALVSDSIGLRPDSLRHVVAEAVEARLILPCDNAPERYRFVHGLFREVLYEELPPGQRAVLHALAARVLERQFADELDLHSDVLAHHFSAAASTGCAQKAVEYCVHTGRIAASQYAWEEACAHWQRGLALLALLPADAEERGPSFAGRLYEDLGDGYGLIGESDRAVEAYEHAANRLSGDDTMGLVRVRLKQADHFRALGRHSQALAVVTQSDALLGAPGDARGPLWWQAWIEARLHRAGLYSWSGDTGEALALLEAIEPAVESQGTRTQQAEFGRLMWLAALRRCRFAADDDTVKLAQICAKRFVALGSPTDLQDAQMVLGIGYLHSPETRGRAYDHLLSYWELARQHHDVLNQSRALDALSLWHRWREEVELVRSRASTILSMARQKHIVSNLPEARGDLAWAAWRTGRIDEARALATTGLAELESLFPRSPFEWRVRWPLFGLNRAAGDLDEAAVHARAMRDPLQSKMPDHLETLLQTFVEQHAQGLSETRGTADSLAAAAGNLGYL